MQSAETVLNVLRERGRRGLPCTTAEDSGHRRPSASPGHRPPHRAGHPAHGAAVRVVPAPRSGGNPPGPQARRPRPTGATTARVGATDGQTAPQDPRGLRGLPPGHPRRATDRDTHGIVTGELRASKGARVVRTGGRWKRRRTQRKPRQRPTGVCATRRSVISPVYPGETRRNVSGSNDLPGSEK
jgi:hypothetical protein